MLKNMKKFNLGKANQNKGFTLIEMLVVIAIVGILSATVLTALGPSRKKAKDSRIISDINQIRVQAEIFYSNRGYYENDDQSDNIEKDD